MKTIYKYNLELLGTQTLSIPSDAEFLSVQEQGGQLALWAVVDTDLPEREFTITLHGTGNPMPELHGCYIDTVQMDGMVWHFFWL